MTYLIPNSMYYAIYKERNRNLLIWDDLWEEI